MPRCRRAALLWLLRALLWLLRYLLGVLLLAGLFMAAQFVLGAV